MAKDKAKVPGFEKIPAPGPNELRPHMRDAGKGPLGYVQPTNFVMDVGAPRDPNTYWRGTKSPASPTFTAGVPMGVNPKRKPEEQSLRIHTGIVSDERSKKTTQEVRRP